MIILIDVKEKIFDEIQSSIIRNSAELSHSDKEDQQKKKKNHIYDNLMAYFYS